MMEKARIQKAFDLASAELLSRRTPDGHWTGRLSASALSTATAVSALSIFRRTLRGNGRQRLSAKQTVWLDHLIRGGVDWLLNHQNVDGGWGDTDKSFSNISTTLLAKSALLLSSIALNSSEASAKHDSVRSGWSEEVIRRADKFIKKAGGIDAVKKRYGKDLTFSVPILMNAALAGLVSWNEVEQLPFERAAVPQSMFRLMNLHVVSYAIPALVAIGQVRFHFLKPRFQPLRNLLRKLAVKPTLRLIERMQPESGGYLEAAPLTAFVVMSLVSSGQIDSPVVEKGIRFLFDSVRPDGSWPIDTNLATWATTLSVLALGKDVFETELRTTAPSDGKNQVDQLDKRVDRLIDWILTCQHKTKHPFTGANAGGWGWTDLSGAVPDGDDTPGAILALLELYPLVENEEKRRKMDQAIATGISWLSKLQNADGGMPTFCRGWGLLPFDQSSTDLTAHAIRAEIAWIKHRTKISRPDRSFYQKILFLIKTQKKEGAWLPLWFGNQHQPDDINPFYGTAKVLRAFADLGNWNQSEKEIYSEVVCKGLNWLVERQNPDGGWGCSVVDHKNPIDYRSSIEETAVVLEALSFFRDEIEAPYQKGLRFLIEQVESGRWKESSPIGLYFAKLWYYEDLYPIIFATAALRRAIESEHAVVQEPNTPRRKASG